MMKKNNRNITEGNIGKILTRLTIPMVFGMLSIVIFNLVDTYFVGKIGVNELAAMGFTFPVVSFIMSLSTGLGIGTSSLISRMFVSKDKSVVRKYSINALLLAVLLIIIFVTAGQLTIYPLFRLIGASDNLIPLIKEYMEIWYWGMVFVVVPMVGNNIIRATGDTLTPGLIMIFSAILNIILDPIFIFGFASIPAMGLKGAAIATVIARALSFIFSLYILIYRDKLISVYIPKLKEMLSVWRKIIFIAGPSALSILITPISIAIITGIVSNFGSEAVAGFGVVSRIEMFFMLVITSLGSVLTIFSGQHFGIKSFKRINKAFRISSLFSISWSLVIAIICYFSADVIAALFTSNHNVIEVSANYLQIVSIGYGFQGIVMIGVATLNGLNKPLSALMITFIRMGALYVPIAYIGAKLYGLQGIFIACLLANLISGGLMFGVVIRRVSLEVNRSIS